MDLKAFFWNSVMVAILAGNRWGGHLASCQENLQNSDIIGYLVLYGFKWNMNVNCSLHGQKKKKMTMTTISFIFSPNKVGHIFFYCKSY